MKRIFSILFAVVLVLSFSLIPATPVMAATLTVDTSQANTPPNYHTIQAAINAAGTGDTVYVRSGTYYEHVTIGTSLTLQGEDRDTTVVDGSGSGNVIYVTANYVTISGFTVTNGDYGINLIPNWTIHHITIRDSMITSNSQEGIYAMHSGGYHLIEDSTISNNGGCGFYGHQFGNSIIRNCEVFGNYRGLITGWGSNTLITNNEVHHNARWGIWLDSMTDTIVETNNVYSNDVGGIGIGFVARDNTIRDNVLRHNTTWGVYIEWRPYGNRVYHNDLIENTIQAWDHDGGGGIWDDGYPSGGNYWSDYTGVDLYSGVNQNQPGSDGIGDTPYVFDYQQDNYPLMRPWNVVQVTIDIKPGSDPNSINLKSKGLIPVAILGSDIFDVTTVDVTTLNFEGASPAHDLTDSETYNEHLQYVNDDDYLDLVSHYKTQECTDLTDTSTEATLTGATNFGMPIEGTDSVKIVGK